MIHERSFGIDEYNDLVNGLQAALRNPSRLGPREDADALSEALDELLRHSYVKSSGYDAETGTVSRVSASFNERTVWVALSERSPAFNRRRWAAVAREEGAYVDNSSRLIEEHEAYMVGYWERKRRAAAFEKELRHERIRGDYERFLAAKPGGSVREFAEMFGHSYGPACEATRELRAAKRP